MLHLLVDGVEVFGPADQLADQLVLGQLGLDDGDDLLNVLLALLDALCYPLGQRRVDVRLLIRMTRMSSAIEMSILRKFSACFSS